MIKITEDLWELILYLQTSDFLNRFEIVFYSFFRFVLEGTRPWNITRVYYEMMEL